MRFVTKDIHAFLDYPVALLLIGGPFLLGLGADNPMALWLGVATGVAAFILTVLTNHKTGVIRVLPYPFHVLVDGLVGVTFVIAPFALGFAGLDMWFYVVNGAAVLTVVSLSNPASLSMSSEPAPAA